MRDARLDQLKPTASSLRVVGVNATSARRARMCSHSTFARRDLDAADRTRTRERVAAPEIVAQDHGSPEIELRRLRAQTPDRRCLLDELHTTMPVIQCNCLGMQKDFDRWNETKKKTDAAKFTQYVHIREVWWCALGVNIGREEDGNEEFFERPVLVLNKFNEDMVLAIPMTSTVRNTPYHFRIPYNGAEVALVLSQLRLVSTKRLRRRMFQMPEPLFDEVRVAVQRVIASGF